MPPDNYRILPVLLEGFNLPSWNASQSWESAGAFFLIHANEIGTELTCHQPVRDHAGNEPRTQDESDNPLL